MSKDMWCAAHDIAVQEMLEANPEMEWITAYEHPDNIVRADKLCRERYADLIDEARMRAKENM